MVELAGLTVGSLHQILTEVRAASINPTDAKRRIWETGRFSKTTSSDFAGVVKVVGYENTGFAPWNRVSGTGLHTIRFHHVSFAEYISVPMGIVTALSDSVSFEEVQPSLCVTACRGLVDHNGLVPADTYLIHDGTSSVGNVTVQLDRHLQWKPLRQHRNVGARSRNSVPM